MLQVKLLIPHTFLSFWFIKHECVSLGSDGEEDALVGIKQMLNDYKHHIGCEREQAAVSCACHVTAPAWQISSNAQLVFIR